MLSFLKVFVRYFSAALQTEYRSKGIIVQVCKMYLFYSIKNIIFNSSASLLVLLLLPCLV